MEITKEEAIFNVKSSLEREIAELKQEIKILKRRVVELETNKKNYPEIHLPCGRCGRCGRCGKNDRRTATSPEGYWEPIYF